MTDIKSLHPGEHFMFMSYEWVCLDPNHPDGGVLAIMATPWTKDMKFCSDEWYADEKGNWNNYRTSFLREALNDSLADELGNNLLLHKVDLVADNGDRAYGTVQNHVFILTCDEYRKYRDFIPQYNDWVWTATPWYCGNKDSDTGYADSVRGVNTDGWLDSHYAYSNLAVAPACILNPASLNLRQSIACVKEVSE